MSRMKKIFSLILSIQFLCLPVLADYDFSDAAQEEFDRQQQINMQGYDFSKTKTRSEINKSKNSKNKVQQKIHYEPSPAPPTDSLLIDTQPQQTQQFYPIQDDLLQQINRQEQQIVNPHNSQQQKLYGHIVKVPAGTKFDVTFDSGVSSGSMEKNDRLTVRLTNDLKYNGQLVAPAGSLVYGTATEARNAGYAYGGGAIELNFNEILMPDGNMLSISTKKIIMQADSKRAAKMSRDIVLGALGSMLLGAAFTAMGGGNDWGRNMLIYGGIGALGGGVHGAMQRGEEITIPDGTTITVTLTESLNTAPYYMQ